MCFLTFWALNEENNFKRHEIMNSNENITEWLQQPLSAKHMAD